MTPTFPADYFDGRVSTSHRAQVTVSSAGLTVHLPDQEDVTWPSAELHVVQGALPGQHLYIRRRMEWLVIPDAECLNSLAAVAPHPHLQPQQSRMTLLKLATRAALSLAVVASACYFWVLPTSVSLLTPHVPTAWESMLGDAVVRQMAPLPVETSRETEELDRLLTVLTDEVQSPYQFRLRIANSEDVNAFAAPGGTLVVNSGLLTRLSGPDELLGILAHEVAHVKLRHTTQALLYNIGLQMFMTALTADTTMGVLAWTLGSLHHSRQAEEEADREGMRLLQAARLDPTAMVRAYQVLKEAPDYGFPIPAYFSTHPQTEERIGKLEAIAKAAHYTPRTLGNRVEWEHIQLIGTSVSPEDLPAEEEMSSPQYMDLDG